MIIHYFLPILLTFLLSYSKREFIFDRLFFIGITIFLCFGYMSGSDWVSYEQVYNSGFLDKTVEVGYMAISNLLSNLGVDFWFFYIVIKTLAFVVFYRIIFKNKNEDPYFSFMIFLASFGYFMFIDCPFRNLIAVSIFLLSIKYIISKDYLRYALVVILASTFHLTALIMLPIIFLEKLSKVKSKNLLFIYLFLYLFLLLGGINLLFNITETIFPYMYKRLIFYMDRSVSVSALYSPGLLIRFFVFVLMLYYREMITERYKRGELIINLSYVYIILSLISYAFPLLFRLALYTSPFYVIVVGMIAGILKPFNKLVLKSTFLFLALTITHVTITSKDDYVPYSNIIPYVIKQKFPTYEERKVYNKINSPYREKNKDK